MDTPIRIRPPYPEELPFIYNSWIKSGYRSDLYSKVPLPLYTLNQHNVITELVKRCTVLVAHEKGKPENLFGYIICDWVDKTYVLHYAYVKQLWRNLGILEALLSESGYVRTNAGFYTHLTKASEKVGAKLNLLYNPYLLISPKYAPWSDQIINKIKPPRLTLDADDFNNVDAKTDEEISPKKGST